MRVWGSTDKKQIAQWAMDWANRPVMEDNPYDVPVYNTGAMRECEVCGHVFEEHTGCGGDHCPECGGYGQQIPIS